MVRSACRGPACLNRGEAEVQPSLSSCKKTIELETCPASPCKANFSPYPLHHVGKCTAALSKRLSFSQILQVHRAHAVRDQRGVHIVGCCKTPRAKRDAIAEGISIPSPAHFCCHDSDFTTFWQPDCKLPRAPRHLF